MRRNHGPPEDEFNWRSPGFFPVSVLQLLPRKRENGPAQLTICVLPQKAWNFTANRVFHPKKKSTAYQIHEPRI